MSQSYTYKEYADNRSLCQRYSNYQKRYADQMRDSDRVLVEMVGEAAAGMRGNPRLLDMGCSTGNLLRHLRQAWPHLSCHGGDLMAPVIQNCREDPQLDGMRFEVMDIFHLTPEHPFDIVVVNAVLYLFDDQQFDQALASLSAALSPGAYLLVFDFFHDFQQNLAITERSRSHPDGLTIHMRSMQEAAAALARHSFVQCDFRPFRISLDLPKGHTYGDNSDGFEDLNTYTERTQDGRRLLFRGALHQPWCHLLARKAEAQEAR